MKRLTMLVVAGMMGLLLAACGEEPKAPAAQTETTVTQPAAEPAAAAAPTEAQAAGAETQE